MKKTLVFIFIVLFSLVACSQTPEKPPSQEPLDSQAESTDPPTASPEPMKTEVRPNTGMTFPWGCLTPHRLSKQLSFLNRGHPHRTVKLATYVMKKTIILSDFDGTITTINVLDSLYEKFGGHGFRNHMERWRRGEISTMEEIELIFRTVKATRQDMEAFLRTVDLDPGDPEIIYVKRLKSADNNTLGTG